MAGELDEISDARKRRLVERFASAASYDQHAVVQRLSAERLAERITAVALPAAPRICELGCGTGFLGEALGARLPQAEWLATDICPEMVARARARLGADGRFRYALVDAEQPAPLERHGPFDLICSNFAAQWFSDLEAVLSRLAGYLRPGGRILLTTLARGTFTEWREAHADLGLSAGAPAYPSPQQLQAMRPNGLLASVSLERHVQDFGSGLAFLDSLRSIGATTPEPGHRPLSAGQLRRVLRRLETRGASITYVVATCDFHRAAQPAGAP